MMKKVGLLGGSFNPPHIGHMLFAQEALCTYELDEIWFIPVNVPPHKGDEEFISNKDRLDLVEACISDWDDFSVCTIELERDGPSYTIETVMELREKFPHVTFYFLIGGDMIDYLPKWERIDELIQLVTFIGVRRPGSKGTSIYSKQVELLDMVQVDISSTLIRDRLKKGMPITYMVPHEVEMIIKERGLYGSKRGTTKNQTSPN